jgi:cellobiose epimerase
MTIRLPEKLLDLFQVIDQHAHDNQYGGYRIAFTKDWQWIKDYKDGPNSAGSFGRKSYDWHLGLVEALATLYDVTGDTRVLARLEELLDIFVNKIIDADLGHGRYYFNDDWSVADREGDSKQCEYGLDLEASWLIVEAAQRVGHPQDPKIRRASLALVDHALKYGFEKEHGGVPLPMLRDRQATKIWNGGSRLRRWSPSSMPISSREIRNTGRPSTLRHVS